MSVCIIHHQWRVPSRFLANHYKGIHLHTHFFITVKNTYASRQIFCLDIKKKGIFLDVHLNRNSRFQNKHALLYCAFWKAVQDKRERERENMREKEEWIKRQKKKEGSTECWKEVHKTFIELVESKSLKVVASKVKGELLSVPPSLDSTRLSTERYVRRGDGMGFNCCLYRHKWR